MTVAATCLVPTAMASRYLQQLCKHWSHSRTVIFTALEGRVTFPKDHRGANWLGDAHLVLRALDSVLECELDASEAAQLEPLKAVVSSHLDRFAFREGALAFEWLYPIDAS